MKATSGLVMMVMLGALVGCTGLRTQSWDPASPGAAGESTATAGARWRAVYFRGAALPAQRPDGAPWHTSKPDNASVVIGGLLGLAAGNPAVGLAIGKALSTSGGDPLAPAPYVVLKVGGTSTRISSAGQTYAPQWLQPIAVDLWSIAPTDTVVAQIIDGIDDSLMGQREYPAAEFLSLGARTLTNLGPVASLDVEVVPVPSRERREFSFVVPGNRSVESLAAGSFDDWTAVPVWNGDTVTIEATGTVCPSSFHDNDCYGPDGADGRWQSYNYAGCKGMPHASLVAIFPGAYQYIGASRQVKAEQSGPVLLFVNDSDERNNRGAFQVRVVVDPPR